MKHKGHNGYLIGTVILLVMFLSYFGNNLSTMYNLDYIDCEFECFKLAFFNTILNTILIGIIPFFIKRLNPVLYYRKVRIIYVINAIICLVISIPLFKYFFETEGGIGLIGSIVFSLAIYYLLNGNTKEKKTYFKCNNCGKKVLEDEISCPHCGELFEEEAKNNEVFKCDNCGAIVTEDATYCSNCGEEFEIDDEELNKLFIEAKNNEYLKKYDKAREMFNNYIDESRKKIKKYDKKGYTFNNCIEFTLAIGQELIEKDCVDLNYETSNAYMHLGYIDFEEKKYDESLKNLNNSLKYNPCNVAALFEIVECYKIQKEFSMFKKSINKVFDKIYHVKDLAHYYRDLGYYYIEKEEYDLAKALYLYSLKYEKSNVVKNELAFIIQKSKNNELPEQNDLISILKKNEIPTFIKKENLAVIKMLKSNVEKSNNLNSPLGKFLEKVIKENASL